MVTIALTQALQEGPLFQHLVSLEAPFCVDQCQADGVGYIEVEAVVDFRKKQLHKSWNISLMRISSHSCQLKVNDMQHGRACRSWHHHERNGNLSLEPCSSQEPTAIMETLLVKSTWFWSQFHCQEDVEESIQAVPVHNSLCWQPASWPRW